MTRRLAGRTGAGAPCALGSALALASALALGSALALPFFVPWGGAVVEAHSGLVAVIPTPTEAKGELRLIFSEAVEPRFSGADLVDSSGGIVSAEAGRVDPADPQVVVVALPVPAAQGSFVSWRVLSAADGHVTSGTIPLVSGAAGPGPAPRGHGGGHLSLEVLAKILAFGGLLLALGLLPFARLVVRPATGGIPRGLPLTQANALIAAAVGGASLLAVTELELAAAGTVVDPLTYVAGNRVGVLLALRTALPLAGGLFAALLVRRGALTRASEASAGTAVLTLGLSALSGHAAAYASPVPVTVDFVHLVAASVWLAGLVGFAGLIGAPTPVAPAALRAMVPRFSALALVSIALLGATGIYAAWLHTGDWTRLASPYDLGLLMKVLLVGAAFALGAVNFLDGGRDLPIGGGLSRRVVVEAGIAVTVIVATASLTSTDPPALTRPVAIAAAGGGGPVSLSLAPGRAGPNLVIVGGPVPVGTAVELTPAAGDGQPIRLTLETLDRLEGSAAEWARAELGERLAAGGTIPAGSWEAAVVPLPSGVAIARFGFGLDGVGVTAGRLAPPVDPATLAGAGLVLVALLAAVAFARGVSLPLVDRAAGRVALAGFAAVGGATGLAILSLGPRT